MGGRRHSSRKGLKEMMMRVDQSRYGNTGRSFDGALGAQPAQRLLAEESTGAVPSIVTNGLTLRMSRELGTTSGFISTP